MGSCKSVIATDIVKNGIKSNNGATN